jgi:hypothetical protein
VGFRAAALRRLGKLDRELVHRYQRGGGGVALIEPPIRASSAALAPAERVRLHPGQTDAPGLLLPGTDADAIAPLCVPIGPFLGAGSRPQVKSALLNLRPLAHASSVPSRRAERILYSRFLTLYSRFILYSSLYSKQAEITVISGDLEFRNCCNHGESEVRRRLPKPKVAGSTPVVRSLESPGKAGVFCCPDSVWLSRVVNLPPVYPRRNLS